MHVIKPLHQVTRAEITAMAHAAAERDEPVASANVFAFGTPNYRAFELDYLERRMTLVELA